MKNNKMIFMWIKVFLVIALLNITCETTPDSVVRVEGKNIIIYFNNLLHSKVVAKFDNGKIKTGDYIPSEFIIISNHPVKDFQFIEQEKQEIQDEIGTGNQFKISGKSENIRKDVIVTIYNDFPTVALYTVKYTNISNEDLVIDNWTNNHYSITVSKKSNNEEPFWSFQSGSYESRPDWVLPLKIGFKQENYMGMNATDYGGGNPVVDIWRKDVGIGVGHLEMVPKLVSLPVEMTESNAANLGVRYKVNKTLKPDESFSTFLTFVSVHQGDFFQTLENYRNIMLKKGIKFNEYPETTYEPIWCAWGYERDFTMEQIYNTLPMVKKLGYQWAVLDDGWQTAEGDWYLVKNKFPQGDRDMKKLVDKIHAEGLKAKLWWAPLATDPGTDLIKEHPDYLLLNEDNSKQHISWWDAYYLCPAYPPVQEYTRNLVKKIMKTWGYNGLKIDGQHLNASPPCYNPAHNHSYPEESFEKVPEFFKIIYETAREVDPEAVVEICPCGTAFAFHTMPYMNQPVASDPESSWQIRLKGKTLKALMGTSVPYYGDHVELSDNRSDFASTVGIGGVIGTKFTWPVGSKKDSKIDLTPEKEKTWAKWNKIYLEKMLPKGIYLGSLYDIGYDRPETHTIKKNSNMYYAFYQDSFKGEVELRGLENKTYRIFDYVNDIDYSTVKGPLAKLPVEFNNYLLLEATPE